MGVGVLWRRGLRVSVGWAVAVLVGVESTAAEVTVAGVAVAGGSSGRTEGRLQARSAKVSSMDDSAHG